MVGEGVCDRKHTLLVKKEACVGELELRASVALVCEEWKTSLRATGIHEALGFITAMCDVHGGFESERDSARDN